MPLAALIFDVDGTLAETEEIHRQAFNASFARAGLGWHWDRDLYAKLLEVTGGKERIRHYIEAHGGVPALDAATIARLHADKTAEYTSLVASGAVALRPGVLRLLDEAQAAGLTLAIATTTSPPNVDALLRATMGPDGPARFAVIAAGDCVPAKKPAPDIYQFALARLGLPPEACIAFEDTPNGLRAALGAGIATVIITSLYGGVDGFEGALAIVDSLGEPDLCSHASRDPLSGSASVTIAQLRVWIRLQGHTTSM